jgi:hypothetical protein
VISPQTAVWMTLVLMSAIAILLPTFLLILQVLGLLDGSPHYSALHAWLHDVGLNVPPLAAAGSLGAAAAGAAGGPGSNSDPCEGERNAVDDAKQQVDSAQNRINALQNNLSGATANLPQQVFDTWAAGQAAQTEWYQNPTLWSAMGPLEQGLQNAVGDPTSMPAPSAFPSTNALLSNLSAYFAGSAVSAAIAAAPLGAWSKGYREQTWESTTVPFATQAFIQSLLQLQAATSMAASLLGQLNQAKTQLDDAEKQLQDAQQALSDCADNSGAP